LRNWIKRKLLNLSQPKVETRGCKKSNRTCSICSKKHWSKGLCKPCYSKKYRQTPKAKEYARNWQKEYRKRPGVKEKLAKRIKEYNQRPEIKAKLKEYRQRPEVKAKIKEYYKEYYQRPGVKAKLNEYQKEYYKTKVPPRVVILDFFEHFSRRKFHSEQEIEDTINNYSKAVCGIQGNCNDVSKKIFENEDFKKLRVMEKMEER